MKQKFDIYETQILEWYFLVSRDLFISLNLLLLCKPDETVWRFDSHPIPSLIFVFVSEEVRFTTKRRFCVTWEFLILFEPPIRLVFSKVSCKGTVNKTV